MRKHFLNLVGALLYLGLDNSQVVVVHDEMTARECYGADCDVLLPPHLGIYRGCYGRPLLSCAPMADNYPPSFSVVDVFGQAVDCYFLSEFADESERTPMD